MSGVSQRGAVGLAVGAFTCWVLADTCLKVAGASALPAAEMIGLVGATEVLLMLGVGLVRRNVRGLWPKRVSGPLFRAALDVGNNVGVVVALRHLPLELFYILIFLAPMVTALLAAAFLGERLMLRKGLALGVGFLGVVVAVDPFGLTRVGDLPGYLACLVCVACFSVNIVSTRKMTQTEVPESLTLFSGLAMAAGGLVGAGWGSAPVPLRVGGMLVLVGVFSVVGSLCFFVALKHTAAANVSQTHYSQLLTGALVSYLVWRERPSLAMVLGAALIVGAGWYAAVQPGAERLTAGTLPE